MTLNTIANLKALKAFFAKKYNIKDLKKSEELLNSKSIKILKLIQ